MTKSKHQKFETKLVNRKDITAADYNPRIISDENRKRLKKSLKDIGLVQPMVYNERTGHLVGGHQRLEILDSLERKDDYDIEVAVIDVPLEDEKKINVHLNNISMMGDWDFGKLSDLTIDNGFDFDELGFSEADFNVMFGADEKFAEYFGDTDEVKKDKDTLKTIKEDRSKMSEKMKVEQSADFYFMVVCDSASQQTELLKAMGMPPYSRIVSSASLARLPQYYEKKQGKVDKS